MITQRIDPDEEFQDPNINYSVLMSKLSKNILDLEEDFQNVKNPAVKGFIHEQILKARREFFDLLKVDLELQHLVLTNPDAYHIEKGGK